MDIDADATPLSKLTLGCETDPRQILQAIDELVEQGIELLCLELPLDLRRTGQGSQAAFTALSYVELIREAVRRGLQVEWRLQALDVPYKQLAHLPAPSLDRLDSPILNGISLPSHQPPLSAEDFSTWQATYEFGLCFWRFGGSFIAIRDRRLASHEKVIIHIDDPDQVRYFQQWGQVTDVQNCNADQQECLDDLLALQLVLQCEQYALVLPYRMTHWPVPEGLI
jgi:hypothetical protein